MAGTSGGGISGSLMFTAGFDFSKAETKAMADVDKIVDNIQRKLDSRKLSAKIDFGAVGDFDKIITKISETVTKIKDAESAFKAMSEASRSGGGVGTTSDLEKTAKQIELLTFKLNEYLTKLDEVARKRKTSASTGLSEEEKAAKAAEERARIMALENNTLDNVIAKRKLLNKELSSQVKGTPEYANTVAQLDKINAIYEQMKREIKEVSTATATEEKKILKELEAEEKARQKQWQAIRKTVDILKQEENSLGAISAKIRVYQQYMQKAEYGSEMWKKAKAQIDRLITAYDRLKISIVEAMSAQLNSINNLNAQLGAYTNRLNSIKIGSNEWKTMALNIRDVSEELNRAQQYLAAFQEKAFQGLSNNFTKNQVAELQRLRAEIDNIDARVNNAYQRALNTGSTDAMRVAMVDINRALDSRMRKEQQINKILTSSADLQAQRQKEINSIIEKRHAKEAELSRQAQQSLNARKQERTILNAHERSIDNINAKLQIQMRRLNSAKYGSGDFDKAISEVNRLTKKLQEAQQRIDILTGKTISGANRQAQAHRKVGEEVQKNRSYLDNLIRRMTIYASIGALGGFLTKIREVTAQFELQRISLGAIIQDQNRANQLFSEIKAFALKSPVKILDLTKYVKQVAAYRIETDKLFDTTKRLADVSVGLGVDMQRIVLAYGQVKAASYLRAAEIRQFTEAGIPLLELLAEKFTKLNGEMVTTEQVMDKVSKRGVSFEMVEEIFKDMTDAGGIFYNMQEKQGNTLYGMWAKLGDAASVMYDKIGNTESVNNAMKSTINLITELMKNWKATGAAITAIGVLGASAMLYKKFAGAGENVLNKKVTIATNERVRAETNLSLALQGRNKREIRAAKAALATANANEQAAIAARNSATQTEKLNTGFKSIASSLASGLGIGLAISAVVSFIYQLKKAWDDAHRLNSELENIEMKGAIDTESSVRNFEYLADKALKTADGSKAQKEALDELHRTYKDMIPVEDLTIENLRKLRASSDDASVAYATLTSSIRESMAERIKQQKKDAYTEEYGGDILKYSRMISTALQKFGKLGANEAERVVSNLLDAVTRAAEKGIPITRDKIIKLLSDAVAEAGVEIDQTIINRIGSADLSDNWFVPDGISLQNLTDAQYKLAEGLNSVEEAARSAAGALGEYKRVIDDMMHAWSLLPVAETFEQQQRNINAQLVDMLTRLEQELNKAGITLKDEWYDLVVFIDSNDLGHVTTIQFDAILKAIGNANPKLRSLIKVMQDEYNKIVPTQDIQNVRNRLEEIARAAGANIDKLSRYWMKSGEDLETYRKRIKDEIEAIGKALLQAEFYKKLAQIAGQPTEVYDEQIEDFRNWKKALEKELEELPNFDKSKSKGSKSDDRLSLLNEIEQALTTINSKYDEMLKKEGQTQALRDINEIYGNQLKYINDIAKTIKGVKLPTFEMPTSYVDLRNYREQILKAIETLKNSKVKGARKAALELEMKIGTEDWKKTEEIIENKLKELSDRISKSKTAREFYDKILSQTGDIDVATQVTMSIYGDTGEGLFEQTIAQIREVFASGVEGVNIPIDTAFDFTNNVIDYGKLAKIYEEYQGQLIEANKSTAQKIVQEGQKVEANRVSTWEKELAKAKDIEAQITDVINQETQRRADIIKSKTYTPEQKQERIQLSYDLQAQKIADLNFQQFKESEYYIQMFEDLANNSTASLMRMRDAIQRVIDTNKDMDPKNMKVMVEALQKIDDTIADKSVFGFGDWVGGFKKLFGTVQTLKQAQAELKAAEAEYALETKLNESEVMAAEFERNQAEQEYLRLKEEEGAESEKTIAAEERLNQATAKVEKAKQKQIATEEKLNKAKNKVANAEKDSAKQLKKMQTAAGKVASVFNAVKEISEGLEYIFGDMTSEMTTWGNVLNSVLETISVFQSALEICIVLQEAFNIASESNPWIALAAAILAVTVGLAKFISDQKVAAANEEIAKQDKILHDLEYTYDRLQKAADKLFGTDYISNYNKQMGVLYAQAEAYRKQYEAESSKGKKADKDAQQDYYDKWIEALDEIKDRRGELVDQFLGTDQTSAAREFAKAWLDAKASFESTTDAMADQYKDMIKNMIVEGAAAKIIDNLLAPMWRQFDAMLDKGEVENAIEQLINGMDGFISKADNGMNILYEALRQKGIDLQEILSDNDNNLTGISRDIATASEESINGLAQGINTQNYYISHVPTISENVMAIRLLMEGGVAPQLGAGSDLVSLQNEHLAQLPVIAANTQATAERCERAAIACEEMSDNIRRVISYKGSTAVLNTSLN